MDLVVPADHRLNLEESEKRYKYLEPARELKKLWNVKVTIKSNYNWRARYSHQRTGKGTWRLGNKRTSGDHQNNSIVEIGQNTKKSPGNVRKLTVTQTPVENYQLTLVWRTLKWFLLFFYPFPLSLFLKPFFVVVFIYING